MIVTAQAPATAARSCRGMGAAIALPVLDAHDAGLRRRRARLAQTSPLRLAFTYVPNGITMADWTPKGEGRGVRVLAHPEAARAVPRGHAGALRAGAPQRHTRSATAPAITRAPPPRTSPACTRGRPRAPTSRTASRSIRSRRSSLASQTRFAVARARLRRLAHGRQLRFGLLLRLHQQPRVARPGDADAARDESAPGVRAAVRRHRHQPAAGDARAPAACTAAASSISSRERTDASSRRTSGRPTAASSTNISRRSARSSGASSRPKQDLTGLTPAIDKPTRHSRALRRLRQADVRSAARRVPDRPDPRRHDDDGARRQHADVSGDRRARSASSADAPPRQRRVDREGDAR